MKLFWLITFIIVLTLVIAESKKYETKNENSLKSNGEKKKFTSKHETKDKTASHKYNNKRVKENEYKKEENVAKQKSVKDRKYQENAVTTDEIPQSEVNVNGVQFTVSSSDKLKKSKTKSKQVVDNFKTKEFDNEKTVRNEETKTDNDNENVINEESNSDPTSKDNNKQTERKERANSKMTKKNYRKAKGDNLQTQQSGYNEKKQKTQNKESQNANERRKREISTSSDENQVKNMMTENEIIGKASDIVQEEEIDSQVLRDDVDSINVDSKNSSTECNCSCIQKAIPTNDAEVTCQNSPTTISSSSSHSIGSEHCVVEKMIPT